MSVLPLVPVADLLSPAKPMKRPTEQRAKPIKRRELKNAALVDVVFMMLFFLVLFGCLWSRSVNGNYRLVAWTECGEVKPSATSPLRSRWRHVPGGFGHWWMRGGRDGLVYKAVIAPFEAGTIFVAWDQ